MESTKQTSISDEATVKPMAVESVKTESAKVENSPAAGVKAESGPAECALKGEDLAQPAEGVKTESGPAECVLKGEDLASKPVQKRSRSKSTAKSPKTKTGKLEELENQVEKKQQGFLLHPDPSVLICFHRNDNFFGSC